MKKIIISFYFLFSAILSVIAQPNRHVLGDVLISLQPNRQPFSLSNRDAFGLDFRASELISETMNIWRVRFDAQKSNEMEVLRWLRAQPEIRIAQFNHYVENRATPNDQSYNKQWQWKNTAFPNADVSAEAAWDITTGGLTPSGDTIVVAVLDAGIDNNHEDLKDNIWRNRLEIPSNNIDDDGNGYIDDYLGWNVEKKNDDTQSLTSNAHGVQVSGMIGAKGNNGKGVTGINWNVKIMTINARASWILSTEANTLASYAYPLKMRKLYNETKGAKGAFVVATNASWGISNGKASDSPLWCNFYDSLGVHGILNFGATVNSNVNIDILGDLPSVCPSDYFIAVQSSNSQNQNGNSGFGKTHIDIAAPGANIFTTTYGGYTNTSGTSFASPLVAGAIALMYSAPSNIMNINDKSPSEAALLMRKVLLSSVDANTYWEQLNASGGRINVFKAVKGIISEAGNCIAPIQIVSNNIIDTATTFTFVKSDSTQSVNLHYKLTNENNYTKISDITNGFRLNSLKKCSEYNYYLEAVCSSKSSESPIKSFKTLGCCEFPILKIDNLKETRLTVSWTPIFGATRYELRYRKSGSWKIDTIINKTSHVIEKLDSCANYEIQISTDCDTKVTFSPSTKFKTLGCGSCIDLNYCIPQANASFEYIKRLRINTLINISGGSATGHSLSSRKLNIKLGENYPVEITPGYAFGSTDLHYQIWLDTNQDGDFDDPSENILDTQKAYKDSIFYGQITIPWGTKLGSTRIRIGAHAIINPADFVKYYPCDNSHLQNTFFGEFEDYCVNIGSDFLPCQNTKKILPTVSPSNIKMTWDTVPKALGYEIRIKEKNTNIWKTDVAFTNAYVFSNIKDCKQYNIDIKTICESDLSVADTLTTNSYCTINDKENITQITDIKVFPNPFDDGIYISFTPLITATHKLEIYNTTGQALSQTQILAQANQKEQLYLGELSFLPKGVYFLKISNNEGASLQKLIK